MNFELLFFGFGLIACALYMLRQANSIIMNAAYATTPDNLFASLMAISGVIALISGVWSLTASVQPSLWK